LDFNKDCRRRQRFMTGAPGKEPECADRYAVISF
jgi:hypothetical protein